MGKYNVGDKVRMVSERGAGWNSRGEMDKYLGAVMTIRETNIFGYDDFYKMEEDRTDNGGNGWLWSAEDIVGLADEVTEVTEVKTETHKYKVGDRVIIEESNIEELRSFAGVEGVIDRINDNPYSDYQYHIQSAKNPYGVWCKVKCFASKKDENKEDKGEQKTEKIVITHDGKTTTATLYREDGTVETATARCAPEDTFDFNVGAKLAFERLMEKVNPINVDGFKVGDRVNFNGINGTVICLARGGANRIGVEFDKATSIAHNCDGIKLIAGTTGTKGTSRWMYTHEITHGEAPQYYNGKVVCVKSPKLLPYTEGKIYQFVDGKMRADDGFYYPVIGKMESFEEWLKNTNAKFISLVE